MNEDESDYILAQLSVAFPTKKLTVPEVSLWGRKLSSFDYETALGALDQVIDTCKFWPSWAEFREALIASRPKEVLELEGPSDCLDKEETLERIQEIKERLTKRL